MLNVYISGLVLLVVQGLAQEVLNLAEPDICPQDRTNDTQIELNNKYLSVYLGKYRNYIGEGVKNH